MAGWSCSCRVFLIPPAYSAVERETQTGFWTSGFSGETEEQFQETITAIDEFELDYSNTSAYSPREKTVAARWTEKFIPEDIKTERLARLNKQVQLNCLKSNRKCIGKNEEILIEGFEKLPLTVKKNDNQITGNIIRNKLNYRPNRISSKSMYIL